MDLVLFILTWTITWMGGFLIGYAFSLYQRDAKKKERDDNAVEPKAQPK